MKTVYIMHAAMFIRALDSPWRKFEHKTQHLLSGTHSLGQYLKLKATQ